MAFSEVNSLDSQVPEQDWITKAVGKDILDDMEAEGTTDGLAYVPPEPGRKDKALQWVRGNPIASVGATFGVGLLIGCRGMALDLREGIWDAGELSAPSNPCAPTCPEAGP